MKYRPRLPLLDRRAVLRGAGTCVALPLLEAMLPAPLRAAPGSAFARPLRLLWVYVPNGVHPPDWFPSAEQPYEGEGAALPWILEPLAELRSRVSVITGLVCDKARANGDGPGDHARSAAAFLTGVQPLKTDGAVRLGISADQAAADLLGERTRFKSLELGTEQGQLSGECDSGYSCAYSANIAWRSETTPAAKETNPRLLFDRLFRGGEDSLAAAARAERELRRKSLLDFVRADAKRLEAKLGHEDRRRLDEYTQGVRELERRIAHSEVTYVEEVPDSARPDGIPGDFEERVQLLSDMLVLAFRTDLTRIATLFVANEGSDRVYRTIGVDEGHHTLSHHGNDAQKHDGIRRINRFHVELFAHLLRGLAGTEEDGSDLLASSLIVYGSAIRDGNRHDHDQLPILLAGEGGGALRPGRHVALAEPVPLMNLHLALLDHAGARVERLGDSTGQLSGI